LALLISSGLLSHKSLPIKGRSLLTRAQEHIKNGKKAFAIVTNNRSPYKSYASTGNLPSGMTMDDYDVYVRKRMNVSLVTDATKPPLEDTLFSAPQIVTSATPASVPPPRYDNAPTEFTVDEDAGSFISCNTTSSVMDENTDNNPVDDDDVGNLMPVDWSFPGFITCLLCLDQSSQVAWYRTGRSC
jgi:hypothetical protein